MLPLTQLAYSRTQRRIYSDVTFVVAPLLYTCLAIEVLLTPKLGGITAAAIIV